MKVSKIFYLGITHFKKFKGQEKLFVVYCIKAGFEKTCSENF